MRGPLSRASDRYLRLLGLTAPPAGLDGLRELVRCHLCRVPFENISKLLLVGREGNGRVPTLTEFLDGSEYSDLGGTCYTNNPFLVDLLRALGYETHLLGADMSNPNVHTSIRVRLDSVAYHVDVGYAGPFREPIPLDRLPHEILYGRERYVFDRRGEDYEMAVYSGTERVHGYVVHGPPRSADFFRHIVLDSYAPGRTFMTCLRATRFFDNQAVELRNRTLTFCRNTEVRDVRLDNRGELRRAFADDLAMPRCPIDEALDILERLTGKPFFDN